VVIAGGYDTLSEYVWAGFNALRLVSGPPLRPFVRGRQGMKVAEGYGIVILERRADAAARGAKALACVAGWGESADAFHLTRPDPSGTGATRSMRMALEQSAIQPRQLGLLTAHATGTPDNDTAEAAAALAVLGEAAADVPVVAFKSHLGHTLGGAGAVELILSAKALTTSHLPGCCNVQPADVEYEGLNLRTGSAVEKRISSTLNTSLGFGGANTSAVLCSADQAPRKFRERRAVCITGIGLLGPGVVGLKSFIAAGGQFPSDKTAIDDDALAALIDARRTRRLSPYVKHMLAATTLALRQARLSDRADLLESTSAVLATTHGSAGYSYDYYGQIVREGIAAANPMLFAEGVPNAGAAHVSLTFGVRGGCRTIIGTTVAGLDALQLAAARIAGGEIPMAIVGAAEEANPIIDRAYRCCNPTAAASVSAAVAFILEPVDAAQARGVAPLALIDRKDAPKPVEKLSHHSLGTFSVGPLATLAMATARDAKTTVEIIEQDRTGPTSRIFIRPHGF
jgi:3-oxoacyl-[acyl-carrier-protein] synthase II